ncbi:glycoside hydrolase family 2 protein [Deinococcus sp. JMULE3]|uniref:beta-mannosidase n=1 Tax=Deinococcus sp. JMULE3 TaxID=2518341 RepID=UPI0015763D8E|nr:glycoside hydrolase family 2 protein [Deinococcus sp. JMULE3]NTY02463.1 glycoside hydrolase family 2 protein [Deinococcus sp. JMULE3]
MTQPHALTQRTPLTGWTLRAPHAPDPHSRARDWLEATVPGTVHGDLLRHGLIPDPFDGLNELDVQWVGQTAWTYRTTFTVTPEQLQSPHLDLCLDGLDTLCTVHLNGAAVLRSDNMFVPHRLDVRAHLHAGENTLTLHFEPVLPHGRALEATHGTRAVWNGDPSRVYVRKAQYHYGWDWGPVILTAGPWKDVTLHAYHARIDDLHAPLTVGPDGTWLDLSATLGGTTRPGDLLRVTLHGPDGAEVARTTLDAHGEPLQARLHVPDPQLWWPRGYGPQPLYTLHVTLDREGVTLDTLTRRLGARTVEVRQDPVAGEPGTSFTFVVNGVPIFAGGANWIPEDLLLDRVTPEQYRHRLQQAADANMVMIRVWGGGIYEHDAFYDTCDELGLLVWQDFLFACGMYPAHPDFLTSVQAEAQAAVRRLRHHASLALWCGNNEDYQVAESVGASGPGGDPARFDALAIYERLLPDVVRSLNPDVPYWPGSPSGGAASHDQTVGDRHTWEIWHGVMAPHRDYGRYEGRFVSEFGLQAPPSLHVIERFTRPEDRHAASRVMEHHNRAADPQGRPDGARRLAAYLSDTFAPPRDFAEYVYATRAVQADAMTSAYRAFRGRWGHAGARAVSGALVWQLNDCWPVTSWSVIDSGGLPKPAYHAIRRELAPLAVQARRDDERLSAWIASSLGADQPAQVHLDVLTLSGERLLTHAWPVTAAANAVTPLDLTDPHLADLKLPGGSVAFLRLLVDGQERSRAALWPEPLKYHDLPDPHLTATVTGDTLTLRAERPARGVWIDAGPHAPRDNHLDLLPGETVTLPLPADIAAASITVRAVSSGAVQAQDLPPRHDAPPHRPAHTPLNAPPVLVIATGSDQGAP